MGLGDTDGGLPRSGCGARRSEAVTGDRVVPGLRAGRRARRGLRVLPLLARLHHVVAPVVAPSASLVHAPCCCGPSSPRSGFRPPALAVARLGRASGAARSVPVDDRHDRAGAERSARGAGARRSPRRLGHSPGRAGPRSSAAGSPTASPRPPRLATVAFLAGSAYVFVDLLTTPPGVWALATCVAVLASATGSLAGGSCSRGRWARPGSADGSGRG